MCFSGLLLLISFREPALFSLMSSLEPVRHLVNFVFVVLVKFLRGGGIAKLSCLPALICGISLQQPLCGRVDISSACLPFVLCRLMRSSPHPLVTTPTSHVTRWSGRTTPTSSSVPCWPICPVLAVAAAAVWRGPEGQARESISGQRLSLFSQRCGHLRPVYSGHLSITLLQAPKGVMENDQATSLYSHLVGGGGGGGLKRVEKINCHLSVLRGDMLHIEVGIQGQIQGVQTPSF